MIMAMTYTDQFETKMAFTEMSLGSGTYRTEYVITGPIGGTPTEVNANIFLLNEEENVRMGYMTYAKGATRVHFDEKKSVPVGDQALVSAQFYNDLQSILA